MLQGRQELLRCGSWRVTESRLVCSSGEAMPYVSQADDCSSYKKLLSK